MVRQFDFNRRLFFKTELDSVGGEAAERALYLAHFALEDDYEKLPITQLSRLYLNDKYSIPMGHYNSMWCAYAAAIEE